MNILIYIDHTCIKQAVVMLYSLFTSNQGEINLYVAYDDNRKTDDGAVEKTVRTLNDYAARWTLKRFVAVPMSDVGDCLTSEDIHRILYLDTDIIVKKSIEGLYNMDMTYTAIAVCEDMYSQINGEEGKKNRASLVMDDTCVLNTGVMLVNVDKLDTPADICELMGNRDDARKKKTFLKYAARCIYTDWDIYNVTPLGYLMDKEMATSGMLAFADRHDIDGLDWNEIGIKFTDITKQIAEGAAIIHYAGTSKPWNPYRKEADIAEETAWIFDKYYLSAEENALNIYNDIVKTKCRTSLPVLIYYGKDFCYNIPNNMLKQLEAAFNRCGVRTVSYDESVEDVYGLIRFVDRKFQAIIGIQGYLFRVKLNRDEYIHDRIYGPKYNMVLDHPVWLENLMTNVPENYYVLTHDKNYKAFIKQYYHEVKDVYILPPASDHELIASDVDYDNRSIDVAFIGTYGDYKEKEKMIDEAMPQVKDMVWRFIETLKAKPELTFEAGFRETLTAEGISMTDDEFFDVFSKLKPAFHYMTYYVRFKAVESLINSGITVNVWGSGWRKSELYGRKNLIVHDDIRMDEMYNVLRDSKISINIMAWHKDGFTERMANSMAAGAVLLTDETTYEADGFCSGVNYESFSIKDMGEIAAKVKRLLSDDDRRKTIARNGRIYACEHATWDNRAKALLGYSGTEVHDGIKYSG